MPKPDDLMRILVALEAGRRRATYGAVAGLLGVPAMFLMNGRPRDPLHSWVVSKRTAMPTGYAPDQQHSDLLRHDHVLQTSDELTAYLDGQ